MSKLQSIKYFLKFFFQKYLELKKYLESLQYFLKFFQQCYFQKFLNLFKSFIYSLNISPKSFLRFAETSLRQSFSMARQTYFAKVTFFFFKKIFKIISTNYFLNLKSFSISIFSLVLTLNSTFAQTGVSPVDTGNFRDFANSLTIDVIATIGTMMMAAAFGFFFYGIAVYIFERAQGKDSGQESKKAQDFMLWGLIALFVMVSAWGIIKMAQGLLSEDFAASNAIPIVPIKFQVLKGSVEKSEEKTTEEADPAAPPTPPDNNPGLPPTSTVKKAGDSCDAEIANDCHNEKLYCDDTLWDECEIIPGTEGGKCLKGDTCKSGLDLECYDKPWSTVEICRKKVQPAGSSSTDTGAKTEAEILEKTCKDGTDTGDSCTKYRECNNKSDKSMYDSELCVKYRKRISSK